MEMENKPKQIELTDLRQLADVGVKQRLVIRCDHFIYALIFEDKIADLIVSDTINNDGKTYVVVFEGGGTCEFDISNSKHIKLMDSHGVDFSWAGNGEVLISPHRPSTAPGSRSFWGRDPEAKPYMSG